MNNDERDEIRGSLKSDLSDHGLTLCASESCWHVVCQVKSIFGDSYCAECKLEHAQDREDERLEIEYLRQA